MFLLKKYLGSILTYLTSLIHIITFVSFAITKHPPTLLCSRFVKLFGYTIYTYLYLEFDFIYS